MTATVLSDSFPNRFQRESLNLVASLLPLSSSAFYLVGADMRHRGVVLRNLEAEAERNYVENFLHLDPLNPALFEHSGERVVCIGELMNTAELLRSEYYTGFMQPLNHRHVADMFFRRDGSIVAVLSMLRDATMGQFKKEELGLLRNLQPFLEYTLNTVYLPRRHRQRQDVSQTYALTEREVDVVELIVAGASNKIIARELGLSLATVKTHIQHVFQKMEISSRTELSAKVLGTGEG
ncbi:MAG: LuxR C-terminal-related transcriptional regulator [Gammaproteobacteria bacterium]|nr:LuxR C-terminal-related transcriptional regulator [Gammaproteobacteria bacterium]